MALLLYVLTCLAVGYLGRDKNIGFLGFFLLSFFITPIASLLILLIGADHPRLKKEHQRQKSV